MTERILKLIPEIVKLYKNKHSTQEIANKLSINVKTVLRVLNREKVEIRGSKSNLLGQKFGRLTANKCLSSDKHQKVLWHCVCDCGNERTVRSSDLTSGKQVSCGCHRKEQSIVNLEEYRAELKDSGARAKNFKGCGDLTGRYISARKHAAMKKSLEFSVDAEFLWDLYLAQNKKCALSGLDISFDSENHTASLDRIDSLIGYTKDNVQWTHKDINLMKMNLDQSTFKRYCKLISDNA